MRIQQLRRSPSLPAHGEPDVRLQRIGRAAQVELKVVTIDAGAATPQHAHARTHLLLVLAGTGAVVTGDDRQLIGPDDVVATAPDESHAMAAGPDAAVRFVCLDGPASERDRGFRERGVPRRERRVR